MAKTLKKGAFESHFLETEDKILVTGSHWQYQMLTAWWLCCEIWPDQQKGTLEKEPTSEGYIGLEKLHDPPIVTQPHEGNNGVYSPLYLQCQPRTWNIVNA